MGLIMSVFSYMQITLKTEVTSNLYELRKEAALVALKNECNVRFSDGNRWWTVSYRDLIECAKHEGEGVE